MNVIIVSSEAVPFAKTGGLADVAGSLPHALREEGVNVSLFLPMYRSIDAKSVSATGYGGAIDVGSRSIKYSVLQSSDDNTYLIDCPELYGREHLYGDASGEYHDNALRFSFFCRAVIESVISMDLNPDIFHLNDWQTALIPLYLKTIYASRLPSVQSVFTIHNLGYQGNFPPTAITVTGLPSSLYDSGDLEFYGHLSYLKAGLVYSDKLVSVSPTYSKEIQGDSHGFGMEGILKKRGAELEGILNGIDYKHWSPEADKLISYPYSPDNMKGKADSKIELCKTAGFTNPQLPLVGIVSRLAYQKGIDIIVEAGGMLAELDINLVILGSGDMELESGLLKMAYKHSDKMMVSAVHDDDAAHWIYAGADMFLMPSRYEPCGLSQLIAMRYGAVPVAHLTGGIADTVIDDKLKGGTGFLFEELSAASLVACLNRALEAYEDKRRWKAIVRRAMKADFSWKFSALKYVEMYSDVLD